MGLESMLPGLFKSMGIDLDDFKIKAQNEISAFRAVGLKCWDKLCAMERAQINGHEDIMARMGALERHIDELLQIISKQHSVELPTSSKFDEKTFFDEDERKE